MLGSVSNAQRVKLADRLARYVDPRCKVSLDRFGIEQSQQAPHKAAESYERFFSEVHLSGLRFHSYLQ